jgi:predicted GH43/DUF377 family glycosyl hydrolase
MMGMNFKTLMKPVPRTAVFQMEGYIVWCGTVTLAEDGLYYLLFSRWPKSSGHNAWVSESEVCCAVSDNPLGPFAFKNIALRGSGGDNWDADVIHNPTVIKVKDKYYMYYMGNKGNGEFWNHRNNQRVGVAVADHPAGPWKRFDKPVIDVTPDSFDHLMTSNPTATVMPDGKILMVYKAVGDGPLPKGGRVICGVAIADKPLGPFVKQAKPIMINPENSWSVEDPYIWYQEDRYYALVKDFQGYFTKQNKNTVALFESLDGINWNPAQTPFAFGLEIEWEDGVIEKLERLERPQLYIEGGRPKVLYCAATKDINGLDAFNVHIPLL